MANPIVNGSIIKYSMACSLPPGAPIPKTPSYPPDAFHSHSVLNSI